MIDYTGEPLYLYVDGELTYEGEEETEGYAFDIAYYHGKYCEVKNADGDILCTFEHNPNHEPAKVGTRAWYAHMHDERTIDDYITNVIEPEEGSITEHQCHCDECKGNK